MRLRPKNWDSFQHYKDRRPPWIRFYHTLIDDDEMWDLSAEDFRYLTFIWLIASEDKDGYLPATKKLAFRLRMSLDECTKLLARLEMWFIYDASATLPIPEQVATPETEAEAETEQRQSRAERPAPPPPRPIAPSPGANGEFIAATALLQDCEIPATSSDIRIVAQVIQFESKQRTVGEAVNYLTNEVREARARGEPVTVFWLKDRKYLAKQKDVYQAFLEGKG